MSPGPLLDSRGGPAFLRAGRGAALADAQVAEQADDLLAAELAVAGLVHALVAGGVLGLVALQDPVDVVAFGVLAPDQLAGRRVIGKRLRLDRVAGKTDAGSVCVGLPIRGRGSDGPVY